MQKVDEQLLEVERLLEVVKPAEAQDKLQGLIYAMGDQELRVWELDLQRTIDRFFPKRRRLLTGALRNRIAPPVQTSSASADSVPRIDILDAAQYESDLRASLTELSNRHIFQWSTFYRDCLADFFEQMLVTRGVSAQLDQLCSITRRELAFHSQEIFNKGFTHLSGVSGKSQDLAVTKSLNGLQRFLELPVEFYSTRAPVSSGLATALTLRRISSSLIAGILIGYGSVRFGHQLGWQLLPRFPRSWSHYVAFLSASDLGAVLADMEPGNFRDGLLRSAVPLIAALDHVIAKASAYIPLPSWGQFAWEHRRLDIALRPPTEADDPHLIELHCYLDAAFVSGDALREAARRTVGLIIAPLKPDLLNMVSTDPQLNNIVLPLGQFDDDGPRSEKRIEDALGLLFYQRRSPRAGAVPLTYNFAREFPLHNAFLTKYFHVYRTSVRDLLRTFERRNGARLWCSVRRSGKTTACFDLSTTTGLSFVVSQTCDSTEQLPNAYLFYDMVSDAVTSGRPISRTFFRDAVSECAIGREGVGDRFVFVLDEYETLFNRLRLAAHRDPELRYTVAQPLLNQMVAFTRDNLLVFLGQQPNAHYIFMDQNQLSAYVEQDSFPLFYHTPHTLSGEFVELVNKVLTDRIAFDSPFVDALYAETSGHPYLTVQVLVDFVDWLINERRQLRSLTLHEADFTAFSSMHLSPSVLSLSPEYAFFREAISEAISEVGRRDNPWLFCIYSVLRRLAHASPVTFACSRAEFDDIVNDLRLGDIGMTSSQVLSTGQQANFFQEKTGTITPRILILGRIAGASSARVFP